MSASLQPSAARPAGGVSGSSAGPRRACPACGGELRETEERRRETKGGFAGRKDCQAALTGKLTTLAEHTYVLPSRLSLREFLCKVWLPAIESGVRRPRSTAIACLSSSTSCRSWERCSCRT